MEALPLRTGRTNCVTNMQQDIESSVTYDAKAWSILQERASDGALFWNVGK
jgi:hypothetical protein